jgi:hypothetical protein
MSRQRGSNPIVPLDTDRFDRVLERILCRHDPDDHLDLHYCRLVADGPTIDVYVTVLAGLVRVRASLTYDEWFDQTTALADVLGALAGDRGLTRVAARPVPGARPDELAFPLPPQGDWRTPRTWPEHVVDGAIAQTRAIVDASTREIYEQAGDLTSRDDPDTIAAGDGAFTEPMNSKPWPPPCPPKRVCSSSPPRSFSRPCCSS